MHHPHLPSKHTLSIAVISTFDIAARSNDYSRNGTRSRWKALILNKVVVGKGYKITQDNPSLAGPPGGYDSVRFRELFKYTHRLTILIQILGETGVSLNHDEIIVFDNDAIRPSWLVMYAP
jgi:hypothetical protein